MDCPNWQRVVVKKSDKTFFVFRLPTNSRFEGQQHREVGVIEVFPGVRCSQG